MPKRKRENEQEDALNKIEDRAVRVKALRLRARVEHGTKALKAAIQLAKGFERQKMSRRQKQAENEPHNLLRLREEHIIVKELDVSKTAQDYLFKQLVKTKRIKESPAFIALYGNDAKFGVPKSTAEGNVLGRLFKANPVKEILPEIMKGIRDVLGLDDVKPPTKSLGGPEAHQTDQQLSGAEGIDNDGTPDSLDKESQLAVDARHKLLEGVEDADISEGPEQEDFASYDVRLAASSDDEDDMSIDGLQHTSESHDSAVSLSSISDDDDNNEDARNGSKSKTSKPITKNPPEPLTRTAFLPSLSMGGYYSGSESDLDDGYDFDRNAPQPAQSLRKNRRGQRARQQIAEKKYGKNAKHLQKPAAKEGQKAAGGRSTDRNAGWDAKRGAVGVGDGKRFGRGGGGRDRMTKPTGANGDVVNQSRARSRTDAAAGGKSKKSGGDTLHPSWEAARKKKIESGNASFSGHKITFE